MIFKKYISFGTVDVQKMNTHC